MQSSACEVTRAGDNNAMNPKGSGFGLGVLGLKIRDLNPYEKTTRHVRTALKCLAIFAADYRICPQLSCWHAYAYRRQQFINGRQANLTVFESKT